LGNQVAEIERLGSARQRSFDTDRDCFALFPPTREIPFIRKTAALVGLDGLYRAVAAFEESALAVLLVHECQTITLRTKLREILDELVSGETEEFGDPRNFRIPDSDKSGPAAAVCATLALVENLWIFNQSRRTTAWC
jgi:hypothetical protein